MSHPPNLYFSGISLVEESPTVVESQPQQTFAKGIEQEFIVDKVKVSEQDTVKVEANMDLDDLMKQFQSLNAKK
jgi:hypothetical protein